MWPFGRNQHVPNWIKVRKLEKWWGSNFTNEERAYLQTLDSFPTAEVGQSIISIKPLKTIPVSVAQELTTFAGSLRRADDRPLQRKVLEEAIRVSKAPIDKHFAIHALVENLYRLRNSDPDALKEVIRLCEASVAISGDAAKDFRQRGITVDSRTLPNHPGYLRLIDIYERQGRRDDAIKLCKQAKKQRWNGEWDLRIEDLKAKS